MSAHKTIFISIPKFPKIRLLGSQAFGQYVLPNSVNFINTYPNNWARGYRRFVCLFVCFSALLYPINLSNQHISPILSSHPSASSTISLHIPISWVTVNCRTFFLHPVFTCPMPSCIKRSRPITYIKYA